ncbi:Uncharacterised protein [Shewanella baltica]|nr:Uncharacterised protein [Shewanella baltica]
MNLVPFLVVLTSFNILIILIIVSYLLLTIFTFNS